MKIMLCTDGSPHGQAALRFGSQIALQSTEPATLLGVLEHSAEKGSLDKALEEGRRFLDGAPTPLLRVRVGHAAEKILDEVMQGDYDMLVMGACGRRGITRFLLGSTSERVARHAPLPVLIVQGERQTIRRILICTGGTESSLAAVKIAGRVAHLTSAKAMVLHVMSQVAITVDTQYTKLQDLEASAETLIMHNTREGAHLHQALGMLKDIGVDAQVNVRHGLVLDEILTELRDGDYDLAVIGEHVADGRMHYLLDDMTHHVVAQIDRPVLVARKTIQHAPVNSNNILLEMLAKEEDKTKQNG